MAKTTLNSALSAISGAISGWVYRQVNGKTVICNRPVVNAHEASAAQIAVRERFRQAATYASAVIASPVQLAVYTPIAQAKRLPVRQVIMTDFLNPPVVQWVHLADFHGEIGDPIGIQASDDCAVAAVNVVLRASDLSILEQGAAELQSGVWVYHATQAHPAGTPVTITATAVDRPGHTGSKTETWS